MKKGQRDKAISSEMAKQAGVVVPDPTPALTPAPTDVTAPARPEWKRATPKPAVRRRQTAQKPAPRKPAATTAMANVMVNAGTKPPPDTKAGTEEYDTFFGLYAEAVRSASRRCNSLLAGLSGEAEGLYFLPLGFIPGPACLLFFKREQVQIWDATPDVCQAVDVPTSLGPVEDLPEKIRDSLDEWRAIVQRLGNEPSPWSGGFAQHLLQGGRVPAWLAMAMPRFRYRSGDRELPFGVVLVPAGDESSVEVSRVYNPGNIPDAPEAGEVMTLDKLIKGRGPVQKMLKTCAGMERNFSSRCDQYGNPRRQDDDRRERR